MKKIIIITIFLLSMFNSCSSVNYQIAERKIRLDSDKRVMIDSKTGQPEMIDVPVQTIKGSAPGGEAAIMVIYLGKDVAPIIKVNVNNEQLISMISSITEMVVIEGLRRLP